MPAAPWRGRDTRAPRACASRRCMRMTVSRDHGETRFPHPPARGRVREGKARTQGYGETRFPHPLTRWEGVAGLRPLAEGWGNPVPPSPHPVGRCGRATPSRKGDGETRFPHRPTRWEGVAGLRPHAGPWGNPVPPSPHPVRRCGRATPLPEKNAQPGYGRAGAGPVWGNGAGAVFASGTARATALNSTRQSQVASAISRCTSCIHTGALSVTLRPPMRI